MRELIKQYYYKAPIVRQLNEVVWANVYHDSIKGYPFLQNLGLNVGRFACNYTLLYLLHRIIEVSKPQRILELGLGESSKLISTYCTHEHPDCKHIIVDHDEAWVKHFSKFQLGACSEVQVFDLYTKRFRDKYETLSYKGFENVAKDGKFQLIAIDGPFGSKKFSRNDVLDHLESIIDTDNFIIVFDDTNRSGEYQTFKGIVSKLEDLGVEHGWCRYYGDKIISLVYSSNYKYLNSL